MSLKTTKDQLIQILVDKDNKVIALSGKWGTGKSFLWDEVKAASADGMVQGALYASLFGLSSIDQVKVKLIQNAVPSLEANPRLWDTAKQTVSTGIKVLEGFHAGFGALNDLGLVFAPAMLRQKLIVLDDIERKHENLNVDEVLGFIDELTQQYDCHFVLILNSDQLAKREVWNTLREKVVDQELCLNTTPTEAFDIAADLTSSPYAENIHTSVEICGLTNIRIIRKVIKAVNQILNNRHELSAAVIKRVIPAIVLLAAIHYKGIEDGPDFDFVLAYGSVRDRALFAKKDGKETDEEKRMAKWRVLLRELGIRSSDDFELLVADYLHFGLFDASKVTEIIDRYVAEDVSMSTRNDCNEFLQRMVWNHKLTETELLSEARTFVDKAHLLDAYTVSTLHEFVSEIPGGLEIADLMLDRWLAAFRERNPNKVDFSRSFFHTKVHSRIKEEFDLVKESAQANTTILEACTSIFVKNGGWGPREEAILKSATVQDIEVLIRTSDIPSLQLFMGKMMELCVNKQNYEMHFGTLMDNFVQACRNITGDTSASRLSKLIRILFAESNLTEQLS